MAEPKNETLTAALELAEMGYRVFPCKTGSKAPATEHGFKDATNDPTVITRWFTEHPDYNLALATGLQPNGLNVVVIDVDAHKGGVLAWRQLCKMHDEVGMRDFPIHDTPNEGFHLFGCTDLPLTNANGFPEGIDTRGEGGYVVLPP